MKAPDGQQEGVPARGEAAEASGTNGPGGTPWTPPETDMPDWPEAVPWPDEPAWEEPRTTWRADASWLDEMFPSAVGVPDAGSLAEPEAPGAGPALAPADPAAEAVAAPAADALPEPAAPEAEPWAGAGTWSAAPAPPEAGPAPDAAAEPWAVAGAWSTVAPAPPETGPASEPWAVAGSWPAATPAAPEAGPATEPLQPEPLPPEAPRAEPEVGSEPPVRPEAAASAPEAAPPQLAEPAEPDAPAAAVTRTPPRPGRGRRRRRPQAVVLAQRAAVLRQRAAVLGQRVSVLGQRAAVLGQRAQPAAEFARRARKRADDIAATAAASGRTFSRLTTVPTLLVVAWLLPGVLLLLAGSLAPAPMFVISIPVARSLTVLGLRWVPGRWPASAQGRGQGAPASFWPPLCTAAVAAGFTAWQIVMNSQQVIATRDQGVYLQFGYWIARHGSASIPVAARAFGGVTHGLTFASLGFAQHGASVSPQFVAGLPVMLAAGFWTGGVSAALVVPPVLGGFAVLTFGGLAGRLAGPRWAPAAALVLALALPEQYTSRSTFSEPAAQILLFGGLCLLIDALCAPAGQPAGGHPWWRRAPGPATLLAGLAGLALGLTAAVRLDGLSDVLPAIPVIGVMYAARKPQWLPFGVGLLVGAGYGLADAYLIARPYADSLASWLRPFGIITAVVAAVTAGCVLAWRQDVVREEAARLLGARPLRWLPDAAAGLAVLGLIVFAARPYVQTVRGDTSRGMVAYVGYLQRLAGLPLDPRRLYAEDTLYWVIWYIGLPAVLLAAMGIALLGRRLTQALTSWQDPDGSARVWALPLLVTGWVVVTVLWRPGIPPDQPWASRRLVPFVLPGLILAAVWAAAWLSAQARKRGAGQPAAAAVAGLCVVALLLPTALTTFGVGVDPAAVVRGESSAGGMALHQTSAGEAGAVRRLCAAIGRGASVVIVDRTVGTEFTQLIRGMCATPAARLTSRSPLAVQAVVAGITRARRRPVLVGANPAELASYGGTPRRVLDLVTTQDSHELTSAPTTPWPARYVIWMSQPS